MILYFNHHCDSWKIKIQLFRQKKPKILTILSYENNSKNTLKALKNLFVVLNLEKNESQNEKLT